MQSERGLGYPYLIDRSIDGENFFLSIGLKKEIENIVKMNNYDLSPWFYGLIYKTEWIKISS